MQTTTHRVALGDCRTLSSVDDESVHLVVTSPPYPMIEMWDAQFCDLDAGIHEALDGEDGERAHELMHRQLDRSWAEIHRVLVPGGIACINIGDATRTLGGEFRLYANHSRILASCLDLGFHALPLVLWRKQTNAPNKFMGSGMLPPSAYVTLEHEYILLLRKGDRRLFGPDVSRSRRAGAYFWEERNTWFSDLWDLKGTRQERHAPTTGRSRTAAFPLEIPLRLIHMYSLPAETVLDPFCGSGTTTCAAIAAGRSSIGFEIDADLLKEAHERIQGSVKELNERIFARLEAHRSYIITRSRDGRAPAHHNVIHGFPVVTSQETDLEIHFIARVHRHGSEFEVSYLAASDSRLPPSPSQEEQPELRL